MALTLKWWFAPDGKMARLYPYASKEGKDKKLALEESVKEGIRETLGALKRDEEVLLKTVSFDKDDRFIQMVLSRKKWTFYLRRTFIESNLKKIIPNLVIAGSSIR